MVAGLTLLNISYLFCGIQDSRISAMAQQSSVGKMIHLARLFLLIGLQLVFYVAVGLHSFQPVTRLAMHGVSIGFLYLGTKLSVIGLTGGIACGKSSVIDILTEKGKGVLKVIDSDKIAHGLYEKPDFIEQVFKIFGKDNVVSSDGKTVDRAKLGAIIFEDKAKRS